MMRWIIAILVGFTLINSCNCFIAVGGVSIPRLASRMYGTSAIKAKKMAKMQASMKQVRVAAPITTTVESDPLMPMVEFIAKVADERKASSIKAFRVAHLTEVTQFVLLIQGSNNRQISAITSSVEDEVLKDFKETPFARDGTAASGWFVLDYGSVIAHVMTPAMSSFYKLEKKWLAAEMVDLSHVISPAASPPEDTYSEQPSTSNMDDWGFHHEQNEDHFSNSDGDSYAKSPDDYSGTYTGTVPFTELPAEDVAFWGEELAEQMYLNQAPLSTTTTIPHIAGLATTVSSAPTLAQEMRSQTASSAKVTPSRESVPSTGNIKHTSLIEKESSADINYPDTHKTVEEKKVTKTLLGRGLRRKAR